MILKDDNRYDYVQKYLIDKKVDVDISLVNHKNYDLIIFPFKKNIDENIYNDGFFSSLKKDTLIFSGIKNDYIEEKCLDYGLKYTVLMDEKSVVQMNAIPTSEGVIAHIIKNREQTIFNSDILVMGYGVCGQDLCAKLKNLGANVYILVRNDIKETLAISRGIKPIYLNDLEDKSFDVIVNTVPSKILSRDLIKKNFRSSMIIDISSKPYGFDVEFMNILCPRFFVLHSIPSKNAVEFAGEILGKYIYRKVKSC